MSEQHINTNGASSEETARRKDRNGNYAGWDLGPFPIKPDDSREERRRKHRKNVSHYKSDVEEQVGKLDTPWEKYTFLQDWIDDPQRPLNTFQIDAAYSVLEEIETGWVDSVRGEEERVSSVKGKIAHLHNVLRNMRESASRWRPKLNLWEYDGIRNGTGLHKVHTEIYERLSYWLDFLTEQHSLKPAGSSRASQALKAEERDDGETKREETSRAGTPTNWRHLTRAALILERHPDLDSKTAFLNEATSMRSELGDHKGETIWVNVHRLAKKELEVNALPEHYCRFEGFRQLVQDLLNGTASKKNTV